MHGQTKETNRGKPSEVFDARASVPASQRVIVELKLLAKPLRPPFGRIRARRAKQQLLQLRIARTMVHGGQQRILPCGLVHDVDLPCSRETAKYPAHRHANNGGTRANSNVLWGTSMLWIRMACLARRLAEGCIISGQEPGLGGETCDPHLTLSPDNRSCFRQ